MNIRICTPVIGKTKEEFINNLKKIQDISDCVELRIDYLEEVSQAIIDEIHQHIVKPTIFTLRRSDEGGKSSINEEIRISLLQSAIGVFECVDIELATVQEHTFIRNEKTKLIVSYHNFEKTPSYWDMQKVIYDMNESNADILKIATMVNEEYEVTKLYRLLTNKPHTEERIVIGMGEHGRMTRILGPLLGGYLTYAATEYGESAPGQIEIKELQNIYSNLI
ncbi:type I 3-dehydroquinate dehydratase [soil metagenome]